MTEIKKYDIIIANNLPISIENQAFVTYSCYTANIQPYLQTVAILLCNQHLKQPGINLWGVVDVVDPQLNKSKHDFTRQAMLNNCKDK